MTISARLLFAATVLAMLVSGLAQGADPPFSLTFSAVPDSAKVGTDVVLKIVLTNTSDHVLGVYRTKGSGVEYDYKVEVRDSRDDPAPMTKHYSNVSGGGSATSGGDFPVQPGKTLEPPEEVVLNKLFELIRPDDYTVQVQRYDGETKTWVRSNTIAIIVTN